MQCILHSYGSRISIAYCIFEGNYNYISSHATKEKPTTNNQTPNTYRVCQTDTSDSE